ncbi:MAG TPA: polyprenyl synthetase family protein [Thermoanaerobaculia bacterium]|nr:polyprenyl synthetase family protein [Thermoanaerobaculia bacterium]
MLSELVKTADTADVLVRLRELCTARGLDRLASSLTDLGELVSADMSQLEEELLAVRSHRRLSEKAASHLLDTGGKRVRPLCVALASRVGAGFTPAALDLAVAVELVHHATLLHDDVVDLAPARRGRPTARVEFGNAASIFAGDWLLIEALFRVRRSGIDELIDSLLHTIAAMIDAESLQLELRGRLDTDRDSYFEIAEGKSATLFRWALGAGGRAGGLGPDHCLALEEFGNHLGVAFQLVDDLLDLTGEPSETGKALFTDLREGKMTYPVIVALERHPALATLLQAVIDGGERTEQPLATAIRELLQQSGAIEESRACAAERVEKAGRALRRLPKTEATAALAMVAESTVRRTR